MRRYPSIVVLCLLAVVSCRPEPAKISDMQQAVIEDRNQALIKQHDAIWDLMGLSPDARTELDGIVRTVNTQVMKNKLGEARKFDHIVVKRAASPLTHDEFVASHRKRFDRLGITASTQKELIQAAEFVWTALHDKKASFTLKQREAAQTIQNMMRKMEGPPPCCDDNIFQRAAVGEEEGQH